jgi:membrane peptidoglycan carboxypeptidase
MWRPGKKHIFLLAVGLFFILPAAFLVWMWVMVTGDAAARIERGAIDRIIASESPVYYDDGVTPIGVFFDETHRKYVHFDEIPKSFVKALIAAEDQEFFQHRGFDLKAILRALLANIQAGKVVQGGSTLTQQTAKNVFRREKRSYIAKLKELIQAVLLERRYSKEEILEMYANQFFVTGYGKGLQIAAQYYFDKEAKDLDLVESAFVAGSVKGPNLYNPFIKKTEAESEEARRLANIRKNYVLHNMYEQNLITEAEYRSAEERDVPFRQGKITYRLNVILDYIREQLESDYFQKVLYEQGVENVATSGIRIHTSINKEIQEAALQSLRHHLPKMDVELMGYSFRQPPEMYQELLEGGLRKSEGDLPFLARVTHVDANRKTGHLVVGWEGGGGIIDLEGLRAMGEAWLLWKRGPGERFDSSHVSDFLKQFRVGDLVSVSWMDSRNAGERLALSKIPQLEGAVVVLQGGMLKAMVGGFFNRYFNRAADAKRQLGSIFKPLLYTAALQLKWNTLDPLPNMPDIFQFQNTLYVPRPDHTPQSNHVSMAWAGAKSENLATVWLLYHLTDHLNLHEFRQITEIVGLAREPKESYGAYKKRIRDRYGVTVDRRALMEAAFELAKKEVESDMIFQGYGAFLETVRGLHYRVPTEKLDLQDSEVQFLARKSFESLTEQNLRMKRSFEQILFHLRQQGQTSNARLRQNLRPHLRHFYCTVGEEEVRVIYTEEILEATAPSMEALTPERLLSDKFPVTTGDIWIEGRIPSGVVDLLETATGVNYKQLLTRMRYEPEVLYHVRDFRVLVNLHYVVYVSERMGISTTLDPVLSFPLGPNAVSILEAALAYQTIMTGKVFPLPPEAGSPGASLITQISDREGETLWSFTPEHRRALSERVAGLVTEILAKVMEIGTGRTAQDQVRLGLTEGKQSVEVPLPCFGKTGTANRYTNSSFVGFVPGPSPQTGELDLREGYVVAAYVGYDDNRPMKSAHRVIYGASGALPLWLDTANAAVNAPDFRNRVQAAELAFEPALDLPLGSDRLQRVWAHPVTGLPRLPAGDMPGGGDTDLLADVDRQDHSWHLKRRFEPMEGEPR